MLMLLARRIQALEDRHIGFCPDPGGGWREFRGGGPPGPGGGGFRSARGWDWGGEGCDQAALRPRVLLGRLFFFFGELVGIDVRRAPPVHTMA